MLAMGVPLLGAALLALRLALLFGTHINYKAFNAQILKLVKADNIERAIKLTNAAPRCSYALALRAALQAGLKNQGRYGPEIQAATTSAFTREMEAQLAGLASLTWLGVGGLVLLVCGVGYGMAYRVPVHTAVHVVAGLGLAAQLYSVVIVRAMKQAMELFPQVSVALGVTLEKRGE